MCGVVGIVSHSPVNQYLYDALTVLQHRGQDAAGIMTINNGMFKLRKANGLVRDVFEQKHMFRLAGNWGIGHVRYPTAGSSTSAEAQPFYTNSPFGISLAHNGNLTNAEDLRAELKSEARRHVNTSSDSELLMNLFAHQICESADMDLQPENVFTAVKAVHKKARGAYAVVAAIVGYGLVAFRDINGVRPLVLGQREAEQGMEYMVASESVALDAVGFSFVRDVAPGEAVYITEDGQLYSEQCSDEAKLVPCIFEYVYFARPDSAIDGISVYDARVQMGKKLGQKIKRVWDHLDIDVVIPIPETSCDIALEIASTLNIPYRQGYVKNRYIGRTFIMPGQQQRRKSVRRKLNAIASEFKGKNVLLVDDSIVRGTTSEQIIEMAREAGAKKVYFASAAPEIRFPNVYGIDMPTPNELIAYGRDVEEVCEMIKADGLIFQDIEDLVVAVKTGNETISKFETSVFDGNYITGDVTQEYLDRLDNIRNDSAKAQENQNQTASLDIHNIN
ncbi:amidophosphoribosyltransferase [Saccharobesus litoralis]|uniref:Amidophosphoribosyltransferase n=1 Tax=Saccharobesus litoralis TaxID=2172099 RepID=A0A2S0VTC5_9ALTE|nr:amidophosphoribosyltransferase [Saccharobesus litoralis]AWB67459.1 amidophosphoribosyltransferase [Saccharobesus litoralis]